jgi:hypothetical protein
MSASCECYGTHDFVLWRKFIGRPSAAARLLGQELLQSGRQQKHCVEVLWSKSTPLTPSFETFKKYLLDGKVGQTGILYLSIKNINALYECNKKEEKPCLMSLLHGEGGAGFLSPPEVSEMT